MRALIIPADGSARFEDIDAELETLQRLVDGHIEAVPARFGANMYLNEEGKLAGLPLNLAATSAVDERVSASDVIVGPAVILGGVDEMGGDTGLDDEQAAQFTRLLGLRGAA
ncbi:DUF3846 domain-containing protein [Tersicoccus sp. MR15.9]|uniref:DUF3846 domain-containing protein n=1 Tax=Tersicoccus mangrovi TaxID=3121635 RepID=UPI002FE5EB99